jgi:hypothetical protein
MGLGGMFEDGARQCRAHWRHWGGGVETLAEGGEHGGERADGGIKEKC